MMVSSHTPFSTRSVAGRPCALGLLLLPGFNSMALNALIDPFRRAIVYPGLERWLVRTVAGPERGTP